MTDFSNSDEYLDKYNPNRLTCVDGGTCHHACANEENDCFRRQCCSPLSNSGWELIDGKWVNIAFLQ